QYMFDASAQRAPRQVVVIGRTLPDVVEVEPGISAQSGLRVSLQPRAQPLVEVLIGGVNRDVSHFVTASYQKRAHPVAPLHGVALLEHREPEEPGDVAPRISY